MQTWKPHSLAKPHEDQLDLSIGDKVRTTVDLPGVAEGTEGKVILANGFNWQRYRVRFEVDGRDTASSSATSTNETSNRSAAPPAAWRRPPSAPPERAERRKPVLNPGQARFRG